MPDRFRWLFKSKKRIFHEKLLVKIAECKDSKRADGFSYRGKFCGYQNFMKSRLVLAQR